MYKNNHYSVAIYKNVSVISELSLDVPLINFQNCYNKIQSIYNITQDLIIAIVDRLDQTQIHHIQYIIQFLAKN
jgi:protein tyrosine phosphatase